MNETKGGELLWNLITEARERPVQVQSSKVAAQRLVFHLRAVLLAALTAQLPAKPQFQVETE